MGGGKKGRERSRDREKEEREKARRSRDSLFSRRRERDKEEEQMGDPLASDAGKRRLGVGRDHLLKGQGRPTDFKIGLLFLKLT